MTNANLKFSLEIPSSHPSVDDLIEQIRDTHDWVRFSYSNPNKDSKLSISFQTVDELKQFALDNKIKVDFPTSLSPIPKITPLVSPRTGKPVTNQYAIDSKTQVVFQSYNSIIARYDKQTKILTLDPYYYDYSVTTKKYLNQFVNQYTPIMSSDIPKSADSAHHPSIIFKDLN